MYVCIRARVSQTLNQTKKVDLISLRNKKKKIAQKRQGSLGTSVCFSRINIYRGGRMN